MEYSISEAELTQLVDELTVQFQDIAKSEASSASMEKSAECSLDKGSVVSAETEKNSGGKIEAGKMVKADEDAGSSAGSSPSASSPEASTSAPAGIEGSSASASHGSPDSDPAVAGDQGAAPDAPPTVEELENLYRQLPPDQLALHIQAVEAVKAQMSAPAAASPSAPPMASPSAPAPGPSAMPPPGPSATAAPGMQLSEAKIKALEDKLAKSEARIAEVSGTLDKTLETLSRATIQRKAVNGLTVIPYLAKAEAEKSARKAFGEMTAQERRAALTEISSKPDLKKKERDLITDAVFAPATVKSEDLEQLFKNHQ